MKKLLIVLFISMSLMAMQDASSATLTLANGFGGLLTTQGPAGTVAGSSSGAPSTVFGTVLPFSSWALSVSEATTVKFDFSDNAVSSVLDSTLRTGDFTLSLAAGVYNFILNPSSANSGFTFEINASNAVGQVPVPAAAWLFGSALLGLAGVIRRKSQPALAA